jgi:hypothetical protein
MHRVRPTSAPRGGLPPAVSLDAPQTAEWGPALWTILHSAAERIGTRRPATGLLVAQRTIDAEEARLWSALLGSLRFSLPCPLCRSHYTAYYLQRIMGDVKAVRTWLWDLHVDVNRRLGRADGCGLEDLSAIYGVPFHHSKLWAVVLEHMMRAVRMGWATREDVLRTTRIMEEMKRWYDFF